MKTAQNLESGARAPLARPWHTATLIALMVSVAAVGTFLTNRGGALSPPRPASRITTVYVPMIVVQWCLLIYVSRIGRARSALGALLGQRWHRLGRACADVAFAALGWVLIQSLEFGWIRWVAAARNDVTLAVLPSTHAEQLAWIVVAASVGFCEEVVYRGYLQTQLTAFTGSAAVAVILQSVLFGIAHGEQGALAMVRIGIYGLALGILANCRRNLLPGILCHIAIDLTSGLAGL